jgi:hypothetical protein
MKNTLALLLLFLVGNGAFAQTKSDAATLITTAQISQLFGVNVNDGKSIMSGKYISHRSADNKTEVIVQYTDFHTPAAAADMLKREHDGSFDLVAKGQKAAGIYTEAKPVDFAGASAFYMTSPGNDYSPGNQVRLQFVLGSCMLTFDTKGIAKEKVTAKLGDVYKIIKGNFK